MAPVAKTRNFDRPVGNVLLHGTQQKELSSLINQLQSSDSLKEVMDELRRLEADKKAIAEAGSREHAGLSLQIGYALNDMVVMRGIQLQECMRRWDKNQDGQFSKNEFRTGVRAPINSVVNFGLGVPADVPVVDQFFEDVVAQGDGTTAVNRQRLAAVLKKLRSAALVNIKELDELNAKANEYNRRGERAKQMMEETILGETELARIRSKWEEKMPIEARVAVAMIKRQMKVHTIRQVFNDAGDDLISKKEWEAHIKSDLHVDAPKEDIDALFDSYDLNKDGKLDMEELAPMLKRLTEVAMEWQVEQSDEERMLVKQLRAIVKAQKAYAAERAKDALGDEPGGRRSFFGRKSSSEKLVPETSLAKGKYDSLKTLAGVHAPMNAPSGAPVAAGANVEASSKSEHSAVSFTEPQEVAPSREQKGAQSGLQRSDSGSSVVQSMRNSIAGMFGRLSTVVRQSSMRLSTMRASIWSRASDTMRGSASSFSKRGSRETAGFAPPQTEMINSQDVLGKGTTTV